MKASHDAPLPAAHRAALRLCPARLAATTAPEVDVKLDHGGVWQTKAKQTATEGFIEIHNTGATDDVLTAWSCPDAGNTDAGRQGGQAAGQLVIPAGRTVTLAHAGIHLLLNDLHYPVARGTIMPCAFTFARSGELGGFLNAVNRHGARPMRAAAGQSDEFFVSYSFPLSGDAGEGADRQGGRRKCRGRPAAAALPGFEEETYLRFNPDVLVAVRAGKFPSGREHFERFGRAEGRPVAAPGGLPRDRVIITADPDRAAEKPRQPVGAVDAVRLSAPAGFLSSAG